MCSWLAARAGSCARSPTPAAISGGLWTRAAVTASWSLARGTGRDLICAPGGWSKDRPCTPSRVTRRGCRTARFRCAAHSCDRCRAWRAAVALARSRGNSSRCIARLVSRRALGRRWCKTRQLGWADGEYAEDDEAKQGHDADSVRPACVGHGQEAEADHEARDRETRQQARGERPRRSCTHPCRTRPCRTRRGARGVKPPVKPAIAIEIPLAKCATAPSQSSRSFR